MGLQILRHLLCCSGFGVCQYTFTRSALHLPHFEQSQNPGLSAAQPAWPRESGHACIRTWGPGGLQPPCSGRHQNARTTPQGGHRILPLPGTRRRDRTRAHRRPGEWDTLNKPRASDSLPCLPDKRFPRGRQVAPAARVSPKRRNAYYQPAAKDHAGQ